MSTQSILEVTNLTKKYDSSEALNGISFDVKAGEIVGLLGPNGAGKTTTINIVLGILEATSGVVTILGDDLIQHRSKIMRKVNFAAVYAHIPGNLTIWQNLTIFGLLYGVKNLKDTIRFLMSEFSLEKFAHSKVGILSSGEQTRVNLAKAMINSPQLLLLDEPTASLDPSTSQTIRDKIKAYATQSQTGVLWTSHNMHEVEEVCDRVLFLSHGKILLAGNPKTLPQQHNKNNLEELFITVAREPLSLEA